MSLNPNASVIETAAKLFDRSWPLAAVKDLDPSALRRAALDGDSAPLSRLTALQMLLSRMDAASPSAQLIAPAEPATPNPGPSQKDIEAARQEYEITRQNLKDVLGMIFRDPETAAYALQNSCRFHWERLASGSLEDRQILIEDPTTPVKMAIAGLKVTPGRIGQLRGTRVFGLNSPERQEALNTIDSNLLEHAVLWYPAKLAYDELMRKSVRAAIGRSNAKATAAAPESKPAGAPTAMERIELETLRQSLKTDAAREWVILRNTNPIEAWRQAELRGRSNGASLLVDEYQSKWWLEARDIARGLMASTEKRADLVGMGLLGAVEASAANNQPTTPGKIL